MWFLVRWISFFKKKKKIDWRGEWIQQIHSLKKCALIKRKRWGGPSNQESHWRGLNVIHNRSGTQQWYESFRYNLYHETFCDRHAFNGHTKQIQNDILDPCVETGRLRPLVSKIIHPFSYIMAGHDSSHVTFGGQERTHTSSVGLNAKISTKTSPARCRNCDCLANLTGIHAGAASNSTQGNHKNPRIQNDKKYN